MDASKPKYYKIGKVVNPLPFRFKTKPLYKSCYVKVCARIDTFLCNHHFFVEPPRMQVYPVCSINFAINEFTEAQVECIDTNKIIVDDSAHRKNIILHTALILKDALGFNCGLKISGKNLHNVQHGGFGSTASLQTAVAIAINNLFGSKISESYLIKFLAQNYGEESNKKGHLSPMASIGGASAIATGHNNLIIIGGESEIWKRYNLSNDYTVLIITPKKLQSKLTHGIDMQLYRDGYAAFKKIGHEWGRIKEYLLTNKIIKDLDVGNTKTLFNLINMYTIGAYGNIPQYFKNRWLTHPIYFDEFIYNIFYDCFKNINRENSCFFVSSGGPSICFVTKEKDIVLNRLKKYKDFSISECKLYSEGPQILLK